MTMEIFLDFFFTIVFSLLFSFLLAKLFSVVSAYDEPDFNRTIPDQKFQPEFNHYDFEIETISGFFSKIVQFDELGELLKNKSLAKQEISILQDSKESQDPLLKGVEVLDLTEQDCDQTKEFKILDSTEEEEEGDEDSVECGYQVKPFDQSYDRETEISLVNEGVGLEKSEEIEIIKDEEVNGEIDNGLFNEEEDDDDWEGIERSGLEREFGAAVATFASIGNGNKKLSPCRDLKLQLYGLHQVAIEGPCLVPQPSSFKVSARAKWNAWQKLGNMSPEAAMEQYINLLRRSIPEWMKDNFEENGKQSSANYNAPRNLVSDSKPALGNQQDAAESERILQLPTANREELSF